MTSKWPVGLSATLDASISLQREHDVWATSSDPGTTKALRRHIAAFKKVQRLIRFPVAFGRTFSFEDTEQLGTLIDRYLDYLGQEERARRRRRHPTRAQALVALMRLVQARTKSPRYRVVGDILRLLIDPGVNDAALRKLASRAKLPDQRATQLRPPKRRKSVQGRKARPHAGSGRRRQHADWKGNPVDM